MLQKYAAALISIAVVLVGYVTQVGDGVFGGPNVVQLGALTAAAVGTFLVPLLDARWQAALKVALPALAALFSAIYPFIAAGHITGQQLAIVGLAVLQALGAQVGSDIRVDTINGRHEA